MKYTIVKLLLIIISLVVEQTNIADYECSLLVLEDAGKVFILYCLKIFKLPFSFDIFIF